MGSRPGRSGALPSEAADIERCLAFVNTLSGRPTASPAERLVSYDALVSWAKETGILRADEAALLGGRARRRTAEAETVVTRARELRELLHAVLVAAEAERAPAPAVLDCLAEYLAGWYTRGRLVAHDGTLQWAYAGADDLDRVLWELTRSATRLIASSALTRARSCAAGDCGWWFVDDTKNHSRRWCDMKICGNREKARRFRARRA
jgi:predicted RNA-binding Zn ribbon-like protein